eukprot:TRINITY_DN2491_c0_g1_i1.p1 TRINITY_DN2491_c0_g1~~TRINITY_DN2491_c0_g1_i1.p1  ORF type:complete len:377 (-),score=51.85 TRINITY_DN2491_c0_g1_i1:67-1197(-)
MHAPFKMHKRYYSNQEQSRMMEPMQFTFKNPQAVQKIAFRPPSRDSKPRPERHAHHATTLSKSFLFEQKESAKRPAREKHGSRQINTSFGCEKTGSDDIADNIEEGVNNTGRIRFMLKMDNVRMIPSRPMRANQYEKENKKNLSEEIEKIENMLKKVVAEKDVNKKFDTVSGLFGKLISVDTRFGGVLKEIKKVYDEKIERMSRKFPQYDKRIHELTSEIAVVRKKSEELNKLLETQKKTMAELNKRTDNPYGQNTLLTSLKMAKHNNNDSLHKFNTNPPPECKKVKGVVIPKLDLSKVPKKFGNEKLVVVHTKTKSKPTAAFSGESESEVSEEEYIGNAKGKLDNTFVYYQSGKKENRKLDLSMGPHTSNHLMYN